MAGGWVASGTEEGWVLAAEGEEEDEEEAEGDDEDDEAVAEVREESMAKFSFGFPGGLARFYSNAI